jgi:hypothetical protein
MIIAKQFAAISPPPVQFGSSNWRQIRVCCSGKKEKKPNWCCTTEIKPLKGKAIWCPKDKTAKKKLNHFELEHRVARFFLVHDTKTGKMYQMNTKYTKRT